MAKEHAETLIKAREAAVEHRRTLAAELLDGNKPELWGEIIKVQNLISTLDEAINDEKNPRANPDKENAEPPLPSVKKMQTSGTLGS